MFCPKCRSEYREGFTHCQSCDVDLVAELNAEPSAFPDWSQPVIVFISSNSAEAALMQTVLEGSGVATDLLDENLSRMDSPLAIIIGGVKIVVPADQEQRAQEILEEYRGQAGQEPAQGQFVPFSFSGAPDLEDDTSEDTTYRCLHCAKVLEPEMQFCPWCGKIPYELNS